MDLPEINRFDFDGKVYEITGTREVASQAHSDEWHQIMVLSIALEDQVAKMSEGTTKTERVEAFQAFCSVFGMLAHEHQKLLNRAAEVVTVEFLADVDDEC